MDWVGMLCIKKEKRGSGFAGLHQYRFLRRRRRLGTFFGSHEVTKPRRGKKGGFANSSGGFVSSRGILGLGSGQGNGGRPSSFRNSLCLRVAVMLRKCRGWMWSCFKKMESHAKTQRRKGGWSAGLLRLMPFWLTQRRQGVGTGCGSHRPFTMRFNPSFMRSAPKFSRKPSFRLLSLR